MNFETVINKKEYYTSINEMIKDHKRCDTIISMKNIIETIKEEMFDRWNVEKIYLIGEILEKDVFNINSIDFYAEIKKDMFEELVDSFWIKHPISFKFIFNVDNTIWEWKDNRWIEGGTLPKYKLLL